MFTMIDGGFNLFIEEIMNIDISWFATTIFFVVMNVLLTIRRFKVWCKHLEIKAERKAKEKEWYKREK